MKSVPQIGREVQLPTNIMQIHFLHHEIVDLPEKSSIHVNNEFKFSSKAKLPVICNIIVLDGCMSVCGEEYTINRVEWSNRKLHMVLTSCDLNNIIS